LCFFPDPQGHGAFGLDILKKLTKKNKQTNSFFKEEIDTPLLTRSL